MKNCKGRFVALAALALMLTLVLGPLALAEGNNLLQNGDLSANDGAAPDHWDTDCWDREEGFTDFSLDATAGPNGGPAIVIANNEANDARYAQDVAVTPGALYRLSADVKVEGAEGSFGASVSFKDTFVHSQPLLDTAGQWQRIEVYGRASADQKTVTVYARLGGYGALSRGTAQFANLSMEQVSSLPAGVSEQSLATNKPASSSATTANGSGLKYLSEIVMLSIVFAAALFFAFKRVRGIEGSPTEKLPNWYFLAAALLGALLVRVVLASVITGYENDIGCWLGWSSGAANNGLFSIYQTQEFLDYPPGYLYVLWGVGWINKLINVQAVQVLICKLPSIAADLAMTVIIYRMARIRTTEREAMILALLYVFNPLIITDSSAWGQIDSILTLIVVGCVWMVYRDKMWQAGLLFGLGVLVKPQMLLFGPLMFSSLVVASIRHKGTAESWLVWLKTIGAGVGTVALLALPFWVNSGDPLWLFKLYLGTLGGYDYASVNACNVLALLGGNWADSSMRILGLPYAFWGYLGIAIASAGTAVLHIRERDNRRVFLWAAVLITALFVLGAYMHERYMYPAIALLILYYILERDRRALYLSGFFSITQFFNVALVLANKHMPTDAIRNGDLFSIANILTNAVWTFLVSLGAIAAFIYMVHAAIHARRPLLDKRGPYDDADEARKERVLSDLNVPKSASQLSMKKKDWLLMGGLTLVYAIIALVYLGTTVVPKNMWHSSRTGDEVVIDLGSVQQIHEIWHYDSLTKGNFKVSASTDGVNYTDEVLIWKKATEAGQDDDLGIYRWKAEGAIDLNSPNRTDNIVDLNPDNGGLEIGSRKNVINFTARYIKLTVTAPPVRLLEIAFKNADGQFVEPLKIASTSFGDVSLANGLIDEQDTLPDRPSFYNGTYFDEIYHARTAWEFIQGMDPYENTHPPLGKNIIAVGILIFGMDPFGWRIMGALFGVFMVPMMYLFGKLMFQRTRYAFITAVLFTFDFMHFVQTRISTIDVYGVFFIICMFFFMYKYIKTNYNTQPLMFTLKPLAYCGILFGLGAASKWICLYAGAGLAVMLFYSLYRRYAEYRAVVTGQVELSQGVGEALRKNFAKKTLLTLLWCIPFFLIIPALIYFASYLPFNAGKGDMWNFKIAWDNQFQMYRYHSTLVDNHYFNSPWYQWPLVIKPMWFYAAELLPSGVIGCISTFGNPAVWWAGTVAIVWLMLRLYRSRRFDLPAAFLLGGYLTEFLPWVLVPRTMFIYHYFASVPFFVLAIVMYIRQWESAKPENRKATLVYVAIVVALFALFYPVLSGLPIPVWYERILKWIPSWIFTTVSGA